MKKKPFLVSTVLVTGLLLETSFAGFAQAETYNHQTQQAEIPSQKPTEPPTTGHLELDQSKLKSIDEKKGNVPERVFGKDDRVRVSNYKDSPYRQVVLLNMTFPDGKTYIGSGTMVGDNAVLTAGHNVYSKGVGFATKITVYAGVNGQNYEIGKAESKKLMTLKQWQDSEDSNYDMALITLDSDLGKKTGTLSVTSNMNVNEPIETSGFPGDKGGNVQYRANGVIKDLTEHNIHYLMDTNPGQSGSSVRNTNQQVIGVHTYGNVDFNGATRLTALNIDYIKHWMDQPAAHPYQKNVKLLNSNSTLWKDLNFKNKVTEKHLKLNGTYKAKYLYHHPNGKTYLSIYDANNKWLGYLDSKDVKILK
ncbi:trypsin-like serine peptidase [Staphylococcus coagulans]|uniref:Serine protease n=1 Tax=Staphylococcus coagulans TaxID=74706 RepID=A0A9X0PEP3_9STAP|nr:trypsin-like serine protease [Staphylococcus coagulans]MBA8770796.1 trypsin-like serine protease [Staphylococcus coagulans]MBA8775814.1 trypsin-like serine protease [Staphylococcus coagulans]